MQPKDFRAVLCNRTEQEVREKPCQLPFRCAHGSISTSLQALQLLMGVRKEMKRE